MKHKSSRDVMEYGNPENNEYRVLLLCVPSTDLRAFFLMINTLTLSRTQLVGTMISPILQELER